MLEAKRFLKNALYVVTHPGETLEAFHRQFRVAQSTMTPETLAQLEPYVPAEGTTVGELIGGVPFEAWSKSDRERLMRGESPRGAPNHPNT